MISPQRMKRLFSFGGKLTKETDAYTMKAVGQDEFEDVKVPDAPVPATQQSAIAAAKK